MNIITSQFIGMPVQVINEGGHKWLTAEEAGRCLGYDKHPRQGIINLYNRHADEFLDDDSREIKLVSRDGKPRQTRIFSNTGCIKLGFFANTPRAKDFRSWASHELAGRGIHAPVADSAVSQLALAREMGGLRDDMRALQADLVGVLKSHVRTSERCSRLQAQVTRLKQREALRARNDMIADMEEAGRPRDEIAHLAGISLGTLRKAIYDLRKAGRIKSNSQQRSLL